MMLVMDAAEGIKVNVQYKRKETIFKMQNCSQRLGRMRERRGHAIMAQNVKLLQAECYKTTY
jgi:hypothetical protein